MNKASATCCSVSRPGFTSSQAGMRNKSYVSTPSYTERGDHDEEEQFSFFPGGGDHNHV